jgi:glycosyltransferase involved in cell wall biosynthesis
MSIEREPRGDAPKLSVIVPVYNSSRELEQSLAALAASSFRDREVIVVDDGSTEPVAPLAAEHGFQCMRIDGPRGPASARNAGAKTARGEYVVFIDADVCVHTDTLARISELFEARPEVAAVVGSYDDSPPEPNFVSQYKNLFHHYVHQRNVGELQTFWSGCGAMRRDLFLSYGGFDERRYSRPAIEDIELGTWLTAAGHRIVLDNEIKVRHLKRWTLWSLVRSDIFDRGVPWTRLMLRAGNVPNALNVTIAQRASVVLVYLAVLAVVAALWFPIAWIVAAAHALAVTTINIDFYRYISSRRGVWFTLRALPLHWLYFGYCGFSVVWGTLAHYLSERYSGSPITSQE